MHCSSLDIFLPKNKKKQHFLPSSDHSKVIILQNFIFQQHKKGNQYQMVIVEDDARARWLREKIKIVYTTATLPAPAAANSCE